MKRTPSSRALLDGFENYLRDEKSRSEKTVENYSRYIARFLNFADEQGARDVCIETVDSFLSWLSKQKTRDGTTLTNKTQNYYRIALRSFLKYLKEEHRDAPNQKQITLLTNERTVPDMLTQEECTLLLRDMQANTSMELRDRAIVTTLLYTGMRVSELCGLTRESVMGDAVVLNTRDVQLPPEAKDTLEAYLAVRRDNDPALFVNNGKRNNRDGSTALTSRSVQRIVTVYAKKAGIEKTVTPKTLRHTRAMFVLQNETNLGEFQKMLGYTHKTSTKTYIGLLGNTKKRDHRT